MKAVTREFVISDAVRSAVPLWLCNFGPSGSGKTWTALEQATGIQQVMGGDIYGIDTEGNRMLAYADYFKFKHVPMTAPFGSLDYLAAIQQIYKAGGRIIIIDSMSHEHDGVGGMLDYQEREVDRMAGNDYAKRERVKMLAWQAPKSARRQLLNGMTSLSNVAFILCFRASDISKPVKKDGKTEVVHMGFNPIGAREFVYEASVSFYLPPASKGVPVWSSENIAEKMMAKLPKQFEDMFRNGEQITRQHGRKLAEWAKGSGPQSSGNGLQERADKLVTAMKAAKSVDALEAVRKRAMPLIGELKATGGPIHDDVALTFEARFNELSEVSQ